MLQTGSGQGIGWTTTLDYFQTSLLAHIPTVSFALLEVAFPPLLLMAMQ